MKRKVLLWIVFSWVILTLINYYYMNFFFLAFELLGLISFLLIVSFIQIVKLLKERNNITQLRIQGVIVLLTLLILTIFRYETDLFIEKIDWWMLKNKRSEIVEQVKNNQLRHNVSWNGIICELPFEFPVVSNGGNDIAIYKSNNKFTVEFYIFRNFFDSPSTQFVYTEDPDVVKTIAGKIKDKPYYNWKISENWYRTYGEYRY